MRADLSQLKMTRNPVTSTAAADWLIAEFERNKYDPHYRGDTYIRPMIQTILCDVVCVQFPDDYSDEHFSCIDSGYEWLPDFPYLSYPMGIDDKDLDICGLCDKGYGSMNHHRTVDCPLLKMRHNPEDWSDM
jgi:uncharacterized CHY-type Zn-finger protein